MIHTGPRGERFPVRRVALTVVICTVGLLISVAGFFHQDVTFLMVGA